MSNSTRERLIEVTATAIKDTDDDFSTVREAAEYILDAVLDALHPEVATVEEASRLIEGTIIRDRRDEVGEIRSAHAQLWIWWAEGDRLQILDTIAFPATVLYRPDDEVGLHVEAGPVSFGDDGFEVSV